MEYNYSKEGQTNNNEDFSQNLKIFDSKKMSERSTYRVGLTKRHSRYVNKFFVQHSLE